MRPCSNAGSIDPGAGRGKRRPPPANVSSFDFDHWSELARRDPQAFFRCRERAIAAYIDAHPGSRERLAALQARIDELRAVAGTPAQALRGIFALLDEQLRALAREARELARENAHLRTAAAARASGAAGAGRAAPETAPPAAPKRVRRPPPHE
ncbi:MAG TPA: hypothetical protein DHV08_15290 [Rhodocyclaceae bacterium]|nr:MAG: hypothetical protein COW56_06495 [Rhodocyclales bacterium CG17_big_fil_post_rev_8_21_14_2_50_68_7]PJA57953.1 MAG: hypothetical protein CO164_04940 [Rhodocyclales bacterium CG_4_9_14_3_um_filter_68_10]HCX34770.1 hypothetical protein [Rhodocyclaceae bacterium]